MKLRYGVPLFSGNQKPSRRPAGVSLLFLRVLLNYVPEKIPVLSRFRPDDADAFSCCHLVTTGLLSGRWDLTGCMRLPEEPGPAECIFRGEIPGCLPVHRGDIHTISCPFRPPRVAYYGCPNHAPDNARVEGVSLVLFFLVPAHNRCYFNGPVTTKKIAVILKFILVTMKGDPVLLWQEDRAMKQNTMKKFFMMKKTCLCIVGLILLGMLCVPVAAATQRPGYWNFDIVNYVKPAKADVELNGDDDLGGKSYQRVYVSDSLDQIEVTFAITAGPDTTLTITKDYITKLRNDGPSGWEPALMAHGGFLTYDVDAIWVDPINTIVSPPFTTPLCQSKVFEHLKERGWVHSEIGDPVDIMPPNHIWERFVES